MFGILVGTGVFWLLLWITMLLAGRAVKSSDAVGVGTIGAGISAIYLIAVIVGKWVSGI